jgi:AcrR family transcriptional regulator
MPRHRFSNTRDRIEQAAIGLFVARGVAETSVRDIARAVDISEGAIYRHFTSKEDLVWKAFERHYLEFAERLHARAEGEVTARGKMAAMIEEFCQAHDDNPALFRFLLFVQHGQLAKLTPEARTPVQVMQSVIERAMAASELPAQSAALATALVFGVVLQPVTFAAHGGLPQTMRPMCERLINAAWAAVTTV